MLLPVKQGFGFSLPERKAAPQFKGGFYIRDNERGEPISPYIATFAYAVRLAKTLAKGESMPVKAINRDELMYLIGQIRNIEQNTSTRFTLTMSQSNGTLRRIR